MNRLARSGSVRFRPANTWTGLIAQARLLWRAPQLLLLALWGLYALFVVVTVFPGLFGNAVFASTGIYLRAPVYGDLEFTVQNLLVGDTVDVELPRTQLFIEQVRSGDFPFWNPYQAGGGDLGALPNGALLSPLSLPYLVLPFHMAPAAVKLLELIVIAVGMSMLLRSWRLPPVTWPLASLVYASSGFMIAWTNWPQSRVAAFVPLALWAAEHLFQSRRWRSTLPLGLVLAAMWFGGFPAVTINTLYFIGFYLLVRSVAEAPRRLGPQLRSLAASLARLAIAVAVSLATAAIQLVPFFLTLRTTVSFGDRQFSGYALEPDALGTMVFPEALGSPSADNLRFGLHPVETLSYVGAVALALALFAFIFARRSAVPRGALAVVLVVTVLLVIVLYWGTPLLSLMQRLPTLSMSPVGRMRSTLGLCFALLAALGLAVLLDRERYLQPLRFRSVGLWVRGFALLGVLASLAIGIRWSNAHARPVELQRIWVISTLVVLVLFGAVALLAWLVRRPSIRAVLTFAATLLVLIPALALAKIWWPVHDRDTLYPVSDSVAYLQRHLGDSRYMSIDNALYIGTSTVYQLRDVAGRGFMTQEWKDLLRVADPGLLRTPTYGMFTAESAATSLVNPVLDRLAVRYAVVGDAALVPGAQENLTGGEGTIQWELGDTITTETATGPVRALSLLSGDSELATTIWVRVRAVDDTGAELFVADVETAFKRGRVMIPLDADEFAADQQWRVEIELVEAPQPLPIGSDADSAVPAVDLIRPVDDGLNVAFVGDGVAVLERTQALPRIRWANEPLVVEDTAERLAQMNGELADDIVVLERAGDLMPASDSQAALTLMPSDDIDLTRVSVETDGPGWVVLSESTRHDGWTAELNGEPVDLVAAEHAGSAVYIPEAGDHELTFRFETPGFRVGAAISIVTGLAILWVTGSAAVAGIRARPTGRGSITAATTGETDA